MKTKIALILLLISFQRSIAQIEKADYSYPPLIMGSSWGNIFQRFFKLGDFETMLKFTSDLSLNKYGRNAVLKYYESMDFGYILKLKSWSKKNNHYILNYDATIKATQIIIRMDLLAGDTAKILLPPDYKTQQFFLYK